MMAVEFIEILFVDEGIDELAAFESAEQAALGLEMSCLIIGFPRSSF